MKTGYHSRFFYFQDMETLRKIFTWIFALLLVAAGVNHFIHPAFYAALIPNWMPLLATNYFTGIIEAGLGLGLLPFISRRVAAIGIVLLMVFFLPIHFIDALRTHPVIGSVFLGWLRLFLQFVLIYWAWFLVPPARAR